MPSIAELKPLDCSAIDFNEMAAVQLLKDFAAYKDGFHGLTARSDDGFYLKNGYFEDIDAESYYAMLRHLKPANVIEVGSGFSTLVARRAIADGGFPCHLAAIDPQPRTTLSKAVDEWINCKVEQVGIDRFSSLKKGDILFIDSTHKLLPGGDVAYLYTQILSRLAPGVLVHIHDVFLPYDYPAIFASWGMNEQYVLHAFLSHNRDFEVLWPGTLLRKNHAQLMAEIFAKPNLDAIIPGSFWIRRREALKQVDVPFATEVEEAVICAS